MVKYEVLDSVLLYSVNVSANTMLSWLCNIVNTTTESHTIRRQVHEY